MSSSSSLSSPGLGLNLRTKAIPQYTEKPMLHAYSDFITVFFDRICITVCPEMKGWSDCTLSGHSKYIDMSVFHVDCDLTHVICGRMCTEQQPVQY